MGGPKEPKDESFRNEGGEAQERPPGRPLMGRRGAFSLRFLV